MNRYETLQHEAALVEEHITSSPEAWQEFLNTAARMYKYSWQDQLNIFAQRPEATAVADMQTWNKRIGRMVKRGSAAIFLRDPKTKGVRYVFDYADTEPYRRKNNLPGDIHLWTLGEHSEAAQIGLSMIYGESEGLQEQIFQAALTEVGGFYEANQQRIDQELSLCNLAKTTDLPQRATLFLRLATMSAAYVIAHRCGIDIMREEQQFTDITLLDYPSAVSALGFAVQSASGTILRNIERAVKEEERNQKKEAMLTSDNTVVTYLQHRDGVDVWYGDAPTGDPQLSVTTAELAEAAETAKQAAQVVPGDPVLDALLRTGGNRNHGVLRIIAYHQLQGTDFASFLREEFCDDGMKPGGKGLILDGTKYAAWYDIEGIHISEGNTVHSTSAYLVTWEQAAMRLSAMLAQGIYQPQNVVNQAIAHERLECAEGLWYLHQDYNSAHERPFFMDEALFKGQGFPESTADIAERLAEPDFLRQTLDELNEFRLAYAEDKSLLRYHYHHPLFLLGRMTKLLYEPVAYPVSTYEEVAPDTFITEDEIDDVIRGRDTDHRLSLYTYFIHTHTRSEQVDYLKKRYGISSYSSGVSRAEHSFVDHTDTGTTFRRGEVEVKLSWSQYAKRLERLVLSGRLLAEMDIESIPRFEREQVIQRVTRFFQFFTWENLPNDPGGDYYRRKAAVAGLMESEQSVQRLLSAMTQNLSGMAEDNPKRERMTGYFDDLATWHNEGTLFLFVPSPEVRELAEKRGVTLYAYPEGHREGSQVTMQEAETEQAVQSSPEPEQYPFHVGDTVYLEDGKAFIIENIGTYDVQLRYPSQLYPILRAESRENLLRLVERYPQQGQQEPPKQEFTTKTVSVHPIEETHLPYDVVIQTIGVPEQQKTQDQPPQEAEQAANYRITDEHLGEGGPKEKFWRNTKAIAVLKQIEGEARQATIEEQHILSQYVGWGGLPDAFDPDKPAWAAEYSELKGLLTDREYAAARASVLNAHFTSPTVIHAVYDAVAQMGFQSGRILEPSMGVGNFFGLLPDSMAQSQLYGVELDSITGRIAKQLYPNAEITVAGFETTNRKDFFDLAVGNVPFGQYQVNDPAYNRLGFSIHNYFFA